MGEIRIEMGENKIPIDKHFPEVLRWKKRETGGKIHFKHM